MGSSESWWLRCMLRAADPRSIRWCFSKPSQHNAPIEVTPLAAETVCVTDPTHPFYGLELPLVGVTRTARIGAVCVVWVRRGVQRVVPVKATELSEELFEPPSPCRLSVESAKALLAMVASFSQAPEEEAHAAETYPAAPESADPATPDSPESGSGSGDRATDGADRSGSLFAGGDMADAGHTGKGPTVRDMGARSEGGGE